VVGYDDSGFMNCVNPPLTTVRQPIEEMGARMTAELLAMVSGSAAPRCAVLDTQLVLRETA
jgi:DNA-binding LacI/PurR family transcriptional regulator